VILLDANLLVYGYAPSSPHHERARAWLEDVFNGPSKVGLPWATIVAFARLMGNRHVVARPLTPAQSWSHVRSWLELEQVWTPLPTERHEQVLGELLLHESRAEVVPDAHLAALAIEHGLTVCSSDSDFARFQGVRWQNPLRAERP
jgi:toxin-antitoxin system PIN domain toxin